MSEVQTRPAASRGRGSGRGGRGGFAARGGRSGGRVNGDKADYTGDTHTQTAFEDEGEIGDLKKLYGSKTSLIKEMFPDWSEVDILFALQETDGDEHLTVTRIAEGTISQWGEVSKPKKTTRVKAKESTTNSSHHDGTAVGARPARGGRNVSEGGRGGRGRNTERGGRGGGRGRSSHAATNGTRHKDTPELSVPTEESTAWAADATNDADATPAWSDDAPAAKDASEKPAAATITAPKSTSSESPKPAPAQNAPKTWASMLRQSTAPKPVAKPKESVAPKPVETPAQLPPTEPAEAPEPEPEPPVELPAEPVEEPAAVEEPAPAIIEPEVALPPSKDQLTETNLEQVYDESKPPATATVASTAADSWDPRQNAASATATPLSASQQQHQQPRPAVPTTNSGFAASALKATTERRTPSFQRRILDQEEAVRMPGNRDVDRTAVKFGAFSLNDEDDIDGDREEPETRAQPPADSPIAHPRATLPPAPQTAAGHDAFGAQKPAGSAPTPTTAPAAPAAPATQPAAAQPPQPPSSAQQFNRFGQGPQEPSSFPQKTADPFSQSNNTSSTQTQSSYDSFPSQQSQQQQSQQPAGGAFSSAPNDYSSYYTADHQNRAPYNYYGQHYGQQQQGGQAQHQEGLPSQQRSFSGYNVSQSDNLSQYPQSGAGGLHNPSRYGGGVTNDAQNSGHTTPNPPAQSQPQGSQGSQPQSHAQNYPYNHPYYNNAYYHNYMNYGGNYGGQGGYGGGPYGKGAMYGQPYGMSPQGPYDHSSSPATGFGQSSLHRADSGLASGLGGGGDFGRAGSAQSANQPGLGGSGFGGVHDTYGRGASSYQTQAGQSFNAASQPSGAASTNDDLKPFGESKTGAGPSPSIGGARPGSAANNNPSSQSGLPPPQSSSQMGGYGGYPSHGQGQGVHGSSGYGMGGGSSGQHGNTPFGSYGQGQGYGGGYYGSGGQGQQQRGWGGNYH